MRFPLILLGVYLLTFVVCAISPHDRAVWWAENLPIMGLVAAVIVVSCRFRFSDVSYLLMTVLPVLHTIGGHYTFELVPFDWVTDLFGFTRNHYDRLAHFSVGFYAYPLAELLHRRKLVGNRFLVLYVPIATILSLAATYEIFEWLYAISSDPTAGAAVLGSQGDVWDAQNDMLADTLGALSSCALYLGLNRRQD